MCRIFSCPAVSHEFEKTSFMLREKQTKKKRRQARKKKKISCYIKKRPPLPKPPADSQSLPNAIRAFVCLCLFARALNVLFSQISQMIKRPPPTRILDCFFAPSCSWFFM